MVLAIAALAEAGVLFDRPDFIDAATDAARLLADVHVVDGRLRRVSRDGVVGQPAGVLEDYADVAEGLLALAQVTASPGLLRRAGELLDACLDHFGDGSGSFFDTADDAETLVRRPQNLTDDATPAGQSALAQALLTYAALTGSTAHRAAAETALGATRVFGARYPRAAGWGLAAAAALLAGPVEIAIVGARGDGPVVAQRLGPLARWWSSSERPGCLPRPVRLSRSRVAAASLRGRRCWRAAGAIDGLPTAYVCRQFVCLRPVTTIEELNAALAV